MELQLDRGGNRKTCMIGVLYINDSVVKFCYILENKWVGIKNANGRNAIPSGVYRVVWTYSEHFKKEMPEILGVPNFSGVRIHGGNTDLDTLGCLITGTNIGLDNESVTGSDIARDKLYALIKQAIDSGEEVWINVQAPTPIDPLTAV